MSTIKAMAVAAMALFFIFHTQMRLYTAANPLNLNHSDENENDASSNALNLCEEQLSKYRRFLLQAILSFEDVCDAYNAHPISPTDVNFFRSYQPPEQRLEIWAFFKLLMAQFNDVDFANVIREAVTDRCRIKSMRDEKRNSVVLGKKQRFHSWGGKRSSKVLSNLENDAAKSGGATDEHNTEHVFYY